MKDWDDPLVSGRPWVPDQVWDYGVARSDRSAQPAPDDSQAFIGRQAWYRLLVQAMPIEGWPDDLRIGSVQVRQVDTPVWTQSTMIIQRPGWRPLYDKTMHHGLIEIREGMRLTIAVLPVELPDEHLGARPIAAWRDEVRAALGLLATVLDERPAQQEIHEDLIVADDTGRPGALVDFARGVRAFRSTTDIRGPDFSLLRSLSGVDSGTDSPELAAARWYLRGAQAGPTPDGIVFLCTAIEALLPTPKNGNKSFNRSAIEGAIVAAGGEVSSLDPPVGRLCGLRADVIHHGREAPEGLTSGFYALEWVTRLLLRDRFGLHGGTWPLAPGESNFVDPETRARADEAAAQPVHRLRHADSGAESYNENPRGS